jgi:hypothetical protein
MFRHFTVYMLWFLKRILIMVKMSGFSKWWQQQRILFQVYVIKKCILKHIQRRKIAFNAAYIKRRFFLTSSLKVSIVDFHRNINIFDNSKRNRNFFHRSNKSYFSHCFFISRFALLFLLSLNLNEKKEKLHILLLFEFVDYLSD